MPFDLFLGIPVHRVPQVVEESGMTVDGWIPVDPFTLETQYPDVYAVGDVTSVGTPKAGVFAEGQAGSSPTPSSPERAAATRAEYDGRGICYLEFGNEEVAKVDVIFEPGQPPDGRLPGAVRRLHGRQAPLRLAAGSSGGSAATWSS